MLGCGSTDLFLKVISISNSHSSHYTSKLYLKSAVTIYKNGFSTKTRSRGINKKSCKLVVVSNKVEIQAVALLLLNNIFSSIFRVQFRKIKFDSSVW